MRECVGVACQRSRATVAQQGDDCMNAIDRLPGLPRPKRRWYQCSLASLLVSFLFVSVGLSVLAARIHEAERLRRAIQTVLAAGGLVMRRAHDGTTLTDVDQPRSQATFAEVLFQPPSGHEIVLISMADETRTYEDLIHPNRPVNDDFITLAGDTWTCRSAAPPPQVISFFCSYRNPSKLDVTRLREFTALEFLDLGERRVSDQDCANLSSCVRLRVLVARQCSNVTDQGIRSLARLSHLQVLRMNACHIGANGSQLLTPLCGLEVLCLNGCKFGTDVARCIGRLAQLQVLELDDTTITDIDLAWFRNLTGLRTLSLRNTSIGDEGTRHLRGLVTLRELDLANTSVTDASLIYLTDLAALETLNLGGTHVSYKAANAFEERVARSVIIR